VKSTNTILDFLCQQGDLDYGRPPVSKPCLLLREQWVDDLFDTTVDELLEDFKRSTQQRYRGGSFLGPPVAFPAEGPQLLVGLLFSRSLEF